MLRKIMAFLAFNVYSFLFVEAFQLNVPYVLDGAKVDEMRARGLIFQLNTWGWNDHYIYRLLAAVVATAGAAFLAGAIVTGRGKRKDQSSSLTFSLQPDKDLPLSSAKFQEESYESTTPQEGGWFAAVANIPSIIFWGVMFYLSTDGHLLADPSNPARGYFKWICLIAIPLTCVVAFWAGREGAQSQRAEFERDTTLGIHPFHWIWAVIPIYIYSVSIIAAGARFAQNLWYGWGQEGLLGTVLYFLTLIPVLAYFYPLQLSHQILSKEKLVTRGKVLRAAAVVGILTIGLTGAIAIDIGSALGLGALGYLGKERTNASPAYVINTVDKWCEYLNGEDLAKKNNALKIEYDVAAIRVDFVDKLSEELTNTLKEDPPKDQPVDDKAIQRLLQEKKLGAWQEQDASGIHLHIADVFASGGEPSKESEAFVSWIAQYRDGLKEDRDKAANPRESMKCVYRTMDNLFDDLVLHGRSQQEQIPLRHTALSYEIKK